MAMLTAENLNVYYGMIHALKDVSFHVDEGEIVITLRADGSDVVFTVADNGVGMEEEQIQAILRKERSDHTGIGIKNVNDRLKIYFGEGYGITIDSEPDVGTTVTIRMPQVREEGEYENR